MEDPRGRLDILIVRSLDLVARSQAPREWPILRRFVEQWVRHKFGPRRPRR